MATAKQDQGIALAFFEYLFGNDDGYIVISTMRPPVKADTYNEQWFQWPSQKSEVMEYVERVTPTHNVYFGVNIYSVPRRIKENALPQNLVWADLDTCHPDKVEIPPQCVIESSPGRYQCIWRLDQKIDPKIIEGYSKRIAYLHADDGVDKGWALSKVLRVPGTYNFKYELDEPPVVELRSMLEQLLPVDLFEALPPPEISDSAIPDIPVPDVDTMPSPEMVLYRYNNALVQYGLASMFARLYGEEPEQDWSKVLWRLIVICFDAGMQADEVFVIAKNAKCNKYERDDRPDSHLWRDVLKAQVDHELRMSLHSTQHVLSMPELLLPHEIDKISPTIIDDYMTWATSATDAVPVYHELGCAVLLSSLMSASLRLDISNKRMVPNIWGMVVGDSTLTRKTTAMDMAMDFVLEVDSELMMGTDASAEGLMSALSLRPKQVSIFYRDEITGFFSSIQRKEYMTALPEIMTKMYDVPQVATRRLRKDTYVVTEPIFIFFGGGIRDRLYSLVTDEFYMSGFMPRFLIVNGYADGVDVRPLGPSTPTHSHQRAELLNTFRSLYQMYSLDQVLITAPDGSQTTISPEVEVIFTSDVWERAAQLETTMVNAARSSFHADKALPAFSRMYVSLLKLTMLLAAARQEPQDHKVLANVGDLLNATSYIQKWSKHSVDMILHSGMASDESLLLAIYHTIERKPGLLRSDVMNAHRLDARRMSMYEETLIQRMLIQVVPRGRGKQYYPIGR